MEVFVRVVEAESFSRAAASLNLANATVTTCINNLERHLGATLLQRNTRHLRLTNEGAEFFSQCHAILDAVTLAESSVKSQMEQMSGLIRVELPVSIGHALICPALNDFARRHPQITVAATLTNQPHNMIEHAIDIAIRMGGVEDAELVARPIYEARYVVCGAPELVKSVGIDPAQVDARQCLGLLEEGNPNPAAWRLTRDLQRVLINPRGPLNFNSSDALVKAAIAGVGLVSVLDVFANRYVDSGELKEAFPDWAAGAKVFYAVTPKTRATSTKIRAFIDFLLQALVSQRPACPNTAVQVQPFQRSAIRRAPGADDA